MTWQVAVGICVLLTGVSLVAFFVSAVVNPLSETTMRLCQVMVGFALLTAILAFGPVVISLLGGKL